MPNPARAVLLGPLLKGVSRSFYITLRVLPVGMRDPIGLAYLLARAADNLVWRETAPAFGKSIRRRIPSTYQAISGL